MTDLAFASATRLAAMVCRREATMMASSSTASTVERGCRGPVGRSAMEPHCFHFATVS